MPRTQRLRTPGKGVGRAFLYSVRTFCSDATGTAITNIVECFKIFRILTDTIQFKLVA